jgi:hypothetical protein
MPLGWWFLLSQNRTSICGLGLRRAVTDYMDNYLSCGTIDIVAAIREISAAARRWRGRAGALS